MMKGCHCFWEINGNVQHLIPPGVPPIKQFEMWSKWPHIVPEEFKDVTCPKPPDASLNKFQQDKNEKSKIRQDTKKAAKKEEAGDEGENPPQPEMHVDDDVDIDDSLDSNLA